MEVPIETVRAPTAIPMIANLIGDKSLLDISLNRISETNSDEVIAPRKTPNDPVVIMPAVIAARKIAAPPPTPNKLGSPKLLRVDNWISTPASPRHPPANILTNILGILIVQTIVCPMLPSSDLSKPLRISLVLRFPGPAINPIRARNINNATRQEYLMALVKLLLVAIFVEFHFSGILQHQRFLVLVIAKRKLNRPQIYCRFVSLLKQRKEESV